MALKDHQPEFNFSGAQVTPDEIDNYTVYHIGNLSDSISWFGTVAPGTVSGTYIVTNTIADYPRSVVVTVTGPSGGVGGTTVVTGKNFFGESINETITLGSVATAGSASGTKVFARVSAATWAPNGVNNQATVSLGYGTMGTAANVPIIGLPVRLGGTADIKAITWVNNGTATVYTTGARANVANHAFVGSAPLAKVHQFDVIIKSSYTNNFGSVKASNLS